MKLYILFTTFICLLTVQLQANSCDLICELSSLKKTSSSAHDCCPGKKASKKETETKSKKISQHCKGNFSQGCIHKLSQMDAAYKYQKVSLNKYSMSNFEYFIHSNFQLMLSKKIYSKVPPDKKRLFYRFITQVKLHILNEALLI